MGMRPLFILFLAVASACNTPTAPFRGVTAHRATIDSSTFDVRVRGETAEAIRINVQYAPRLGPLEGRAARAMAVVSGCDVTRVTGDQALLLGQLDCDGRPRDYRPPEPLSLECERISDALRLEGEPRYADYDCASF